MRLDHAVLATHRLERRVRAGQRASVRPRRGHAPRALPDLEHHEPLAQHEQAVARRTESLAVANGLHQRHERIRVRVLGQVGQRLGRGQVGLVARG